MARPGKFIGMFWTHAVSNFVKSLGQWTVSTASNIVDQLWIICDFHVKSCNPYSWCVHGNNISQYSETICQDKSLLASLWETEISRFIVPSSPSCSIHFILFISVLQCHCINLSLTNALMYHYVTTWPTVYIISNVSTLKVPSSGRIIDTF